MRSWRFILSSKPAARHKNSGYRSRVLLLLTPRAVGHLCDAIGGVPGNTATGTATALSVLESGLPWLHRRGGPKWRPLFVPA
jgi:hypothetical protein